LKDRTATISATMATANGKKTSSIDPPRRIGPMRGPAAILTR
jgi:hypothetical protein